MYSPGQSKEYVRNDVLLYFKNCTNVLTLPNLFFQLESNLLKQGKSVECIEQDIEIYNAQLEIAPKKIKLNNISFNKFDIMKFDGLFLDFCGTLSFEMLDKLQRLNSGTKIAITLLMAREKTIQRIIDIKDRHNSYCNAFANIGYTVDYYLKYHDTTPMCTFFITKQ